jgi:hypothetical protein
MSQLHVNQIRGVLLRSFDGLIDLNDVANLQESDRDSVFLSRALCALTVGHLAGLEHQQAAQMVTDGGGDNGVDGLYYDRSGRTLYIVQSKWFGNGHGSFGADDTGKLVQGFKDLVNQKLERFNDKVRAQKAVIEEAFLADKAKYVLVATYTGQEDIALESRRLFDDCLAEYNDWKDEAASELLEVRVLKQSDIYGLIARGTQGDPVDIEVMVYEYGQVAKPFSVYGQVEAADVADWWSKYYPRLVEPNIRRFLGGDTEVNVGLQNTLLNEPEHFWHFNNGLTVICQTIARKMMGSGRAATSIVCHGASIVNGAQTAGSIALAYAKNREAVSRARVQVRFISIEGDEAPHLAAAITKATNTQNRINRQDFVALDLEQERLRQELSVDGIIYHYKSGDTIIRNDLTFDLEEATVALACAHSDLSLSTQAKREIGRLWDDTGKAPYKALFNGGTSSAAMWRNVRILRIIEVALAAQQGTVDGRDKGYGVHGNRFVAHNVFRRLPVQQTVSLGLPSDIQPKVTELVASTLTATTNIANESFPGAYLAQLFKNQNKLAEIKQAMIMSEGSTTSSAMPPTESAD